MSRPKRDPMRHAFPYVDCKLCRRTYTQADIVDHLRMVHGHEVLAALAARKRGARC